MPNRTTSKGSDGAAVRELEHWIQPQGQLEDWSTDDVSAWFLAKFSFASKYFKKWEEQCISGALLPFLVCTPNGWQGDSIWRPT